MLDNLVKSTAYWFFRTWFFRNRTDRNRCSGLVGAALLLALAGCAIPGGNGADLSERLEQNGYSFLPPAEPRWFIAERSPDRITLARPGRVEGQTYLLEGAHLSLKQHAASQRLTDVVEDLHRRDLPAPRFRIRQHDTSDVRVDGARCALSHVVAEDRQPETTSNVVTAMLIETVTTVCAHPDSPQLAIALNFSHRSFPEDQDRGFEAYASSVLQTLQFSPLTTQPQR